MLEISNFLSKFLSFEKDKNTKLSIILGAIKQETGIELSKEMLDLKEGSVKLNCNAVFRNEIFMHKSQIEFALKPQKIFLNIV